MNDNEKEDGSCNDEMEGVSSQRGWPEQMECE